jgi:hypothetical protein
VVSAVESLSDRILDILAKGHTRADVSLALEVVRGAGISLRPTFLPFTPWTTIDDYLDLCHFVLHHDLIEEVDPVQLSLRLLLPPGSLLLEHAAMRPHLGALDEARLSFAWTHPDPRMDELQAIVAALVEDAARTRAPAAVTFAKIHDLAAAAAGRAPVTRARSAAASRRVAPPRLSESWFC